MGKEIRILTVEDSPEDLNLVHSRLKKDLISYSLLNVVCKDDFIKGVNEFKPDIILSNFTSVGLDGFAAIELSKKLSPNTPIIIVPGSIDNDSATACINKGAQESIIKEKIDQLGLAVKGALENKILKLKSSKELNEFAENLINAVHEPMLALDKNLNVVKASQSFYDFFRTNSAETIGNYIFNLNNKQWDIPVLREFLEIILSEKTAFDNYEIEHDFADIGKHIMLLNAKKIKDGIGDEEIILLSLEDITRRRLEEDAFKESEEKFRLITENSADAIFITDSLGKYLYVNTKAERLLGFSKNELLSFTLADISPKTRVDEYFQFFKQLLQDGSLCTELELVKKDGQIMPADLNAVLLPNGFVYASCRDITEKKRFEQKLLESEELFRHSFDYAAIGMCVIGLDKKFHRINSAFKELVGYDEDELKNFTFSDITHPDDLSVGLSVFDKMLDGKINSSTYEKRYIRKDKKIIWVYISISLVRNTHGQPQFFITQITDTTERKRSENLISMFAQSLKSINEIVSITNLENKLLYVNESYLKTYGYAENELIGQHAGIVISPNNPAELAEEIFTATRSGGWKGEALDIRKDGSEFPIYLSTSIVYDIEGKPFGLMGVAIDISERKRVENDLIKAKEIAESVNKLKDAFIANMSHEIRTPLNGILGMTSLIKDLFIDKIKKEDEVLFNGIDQSSKRIIRTVDMILNYSRLQVGEFQTFQKKLNISLLCENLMSEYAVQAKYKSIDFIYQDNCGDVVLLADEFSIKLAISNLIDNAIKFTQKGFIHLILKKESNNDIILQIKDTGIGIDKDDLEKIFESFRQVQMGYGRAYEGVGLGLSLVKKVLALNNAQVSVESIKGKGSTFSINFGNKVNSLDKMEDTKQKVSHSTEPVEAGNVVVLIVEDDKINQLTIQKFLEKKYSTIITDSSDDVLDILKINKVDIILMDISIWGKLNGLELTKVLKTSEEFSHIPVIAVTAHAFEDDKQNAVEAGCDSFLAKPFSKESLLEMISDFINKKAVSS
jgi:PAS domain S-box-containing protein